jgi:hypothetical protein
MGAIEGLDRVNKMRPEGLNKISRIDEILEKGFSRGRAGRE